MLAVAMANHPDHDPSFHSPYGLIGKVKAIRAQLCGVDHQGVVNKTVV
jgi:hypothetical protein